MDGICGAAEDVRGDVQDVCGDVQDVCGNVQDVCGDVQDVSMCMVLKKPYYSDSFFSLSTAPLPVM
jgi:uncharacterized protein YjbJ (UPF0337 family)